MRTTLNIDDDVLEATRVLATASRNSLGRVLSDLARRGFSELNAGSIRNGVPRLPRRPPGRPRPNLELVNHLRDGS